MKHLVVSLHSLLYIASIGIECLYKTQTQYERCWVFKFWAMIMRILPLRNLFSHTKNSLFRKICIVFLFSIFFSIINYFIYSHSIPSIILRSSIFIILFYSSIKKWGRRWNERRNRKEWIWSGKDLFVVIIT